MATIIHCAAEAEDLLKLEPVPGNEEYLSLRTQEGYSDTWDTEIRLDPTRRRQLAAALLDGLPEMDIITVAKPAGAPLPAGWEEVAS